MNCQQRFSKVKSYPCFARAHIEPMYGEPEDSLKYCTKEDKDAFQFGVLPQPGKRNDLIHTVEQVQKGATLRQIANGDVEGASCLVKYTKGLTALRGLTVRPRNPSSPPNVFWLYGATGIGKTRSAYEFGQSLYGDQDASIWISSGSLQWFDGYDGQPFVILDDFRPKHCEFSFFLRLLDRYPLRVPIKGGFVEWNPTYIFITTPECISVTFSTRLVHRSEDIAQLRRRIEHEWELPLNELEMRRTLATYLGGEDGGILEVEMGEGGDGS